MYRRFSKREQAFIRRISKLGSRVEAHVLFKEVIERTNVNYWNASGRHFKVPAELSSKEREEAKMEMIEIALLIDYLEQNDYIVFDDWQNKNVHNFPYGKTTSTANEAIPKKVADIFDKCLESHVFFTQRLLDLVKDKFKTYEERVLNTARWTLVVAVITLIASVIINI